MHRIGYFSVAGRLASMFGWVRVIDASLDFKDSQVDMLRFSVSETRWEGGMNSNKKVFVINFHTKYIWQYKTSDNIVFVGGGGCGGSVSKECIL